MRRRQTEQKKETASAGRLGAKVHAVCSQDRNEGVGLSVDDDDGKNGMYPRGSDACSISLWTANLGISTAAGLQFAVGRG
jgi:hypothetical protein